MRNIIIFFLLTCSIAPCSARLGETIDQSIARYGQPLSHTDQKYGANSELMTFQKAGFVISASFYKGICVGIDYQHANPLKPAAGLAVKDDEIAALPPIEKAEAQELIFENRQDQAWTENEGSPEGTIGWMRPDGTMAILTSSTKVLSIMAPNFDLFSQDVTKPKTSDDGTTAKTNNDLHGL